MNNQTNNTAAAQEKRDFKRPVAWLFGRQFLANFKWALLYTAFGTKLDPRDWMQAEVFPSNNQQEADAFWQPKDGEFWFDYISDVGDGMRAMYSIAYLCMSDLWSVADLNKLPATGAPVGFVAAETTSDVRETERTLPLSGGEMLLPRGAFLFVGGDTTYHLSDYASLHTRFQTPFCWAFEDLKRDGFLRDETRRPLFAIPGNHDYYDMLDGFRRQFRRPLRDEMPASESVPCGKNQQAPQLSIPGFRRFQEASYVALRLPFKWLFWGLDTEVGKIDERQRRFFRSTSDGQTTDASSAGVVPDKLIVAACAPTTVFGKRADKDDEKSAKAFYQLGLPRPFLTEDQLEPDETRMRPDQLRLDLAGDIHHYARYWGPPSEDAAPPRPQSTKTAETMPNYASVVSGIGGAFHHPTTTYADEVREQTLYPAEDVSRRETSQHLFKFWEVWGGGSVWLIGFVLAFVIYFGVNIAQSSRQAVRNFPPLAWLNLVVPVAIEPTIPTDAAAAGGGKVRYFYGANSLSTPTPFKIGVALVLLSLVAIGATFVLSGRLYEKSKQTDESLEQTPAEQNSQHVRRVNMLLWPLVGLTILLIISGISLLKPFRAQITPFGNSLLVLLSIIWAGSAVVLSLRYSEWLFEQSAKRRIELSDWALTWVWTVGAVLSVASALWLFGRNNLTAFLLLDILFTVVVLGTFVMLVLLAVTVGGVMQKGKGKFLMLFVGIWHALLQLMLPYLLVTKGTWLTLILGLVLSVVFMFVGEALMRRNRRGLLVGAWVVYGALMLLLPYLTVRALVGFGLTESGFFWPSRLQQTLAYGSSATDSLSQWFASYEWWGAFGGWWGLVPSLLAGALGAVLCCLWFGWYLAVCLCFHGHNNEAGGAARIERFKELIRFRLTENDLTGYVIAIDDPIDATDEKYETGRQLRPRIIDVFRLKADAGS
ncbi:MAG TPA: hypothetical protein VF666_21350 [Pyrinomonadaceae bacterium]|jgi:hypothetical protein